MNRLPALEHKGGSPYLGFYRSMLCFLLVMVTLNACSMKPTLPRNMALKTFDPHPANLPLPGWTQRLI